VWLLWCIDIRYVCVIRHVNCNTLTRTPTKLEALKDTQTFAGYELLKKGHQTNLVTTKIKLNDGVQTAIKSRCSDEEFRHTVLTSLSNRPLANMAGFYIGCRFQLLLLTVLLLVLWCRIFHIIYLSLTRILDLYVILFQLFDLTIVLC
jgi:hypothetical protein